MSSMTKYRNQYYEAGLCYHCGKVPHREGRKTCQACADELVEFQKARLLKRRAEGLCRCGQVLNEKSLCDECHKKQEVYGSTYTKNHRAEYRARSLKRYYMLRAQGLCTDCGKVETLKVCCPECQAVRSLRRNSN